MKSLSLFGVVVLQLAIASTGHAQQQLNNEIKLGLSYVLSFNGVAKDLELTEEQNERLMGLWIEVKTKLEREFKDYRANYSPRFSDQEKEELQKELAKAIDKIRESETDRLNEVLLPHQMKRLKQIQFQILKRDSDGFSGLADALQLTPDQVKQIGKVKTTIKKKVQELRKRSRSEQLTQNEIADEIDAIRAQSEKDLLDLLSTSQRQKLKELEGEKFEVQTARSKQSKG